MLIIRKRPELTLRSLTIAPISRLYCSKNNSSPGKDGEESKKETRKESKNDEATPQENPKTESAALRLNRLLASMETDDNLTLTRRASETMARPGDGAKKRRDAAKQVAESKDVVLAAKRVASLMGEENQQRTESELLAKLLGNNNQQQQQQQSETATSEDNTKAEAPEADLSLSELIVGMKIDRRQQPKEDTRSDYIRRTLAVTRNQRGTQHTQQDRRQDRRHTNIKREPEPYTGSVNIWGSAPLGIFKEPEKLRDSPDMLGTWAHLYEHDLKLQVTHPPANYFEKIALWTEQGKVWHFPIDNEQDMHEEANVDFSEHVFLEQHLEAWCPTKGPIRHFMELVCVGLSKNPYISAKDKKEHILWYRDYFEAKRDILKDLMDQEKMNIAAASTKKLEA